MDDVVELAFKKALESLKVAELLYDTEHFPDSISNSYYAVFHAAKSLLIKKGILTKTHSGAIQKFGLEYVVNGDFDREIGKVFSKLQEDRGNADYDYSFKVSEKKAKKDLKNAKTFVEECKKFL